MNSLLRRLSLGATRLRVLHRNVTVMRLNSSITLDFAKTTTALQHFYPKPICYTTNRWKSKKVQEDSDDEEENYNEDATLSKDSKVVKCNTTSLRTDLLLKSALGMARNKIEQYFYESKIRVNGKKVLKKSAQIRIGDEIDIVKSQSPKNPDHIHVYRVEVLNIAVKEESIVITARRFKNLVIENYDKDPYKFSSAETEGGN